MRLRERESKNDVGLDFRWSSRGIVLSWVMLWFIHESRLSRIIGCCDGFGETLCRCLESCSGWHAQERAVGMLSSRLVRRFGARKNAVSFSVSAGSGQVTGITAKGVGHVAVVGPGVSHGADWMHSSGGAEVITCESRIKAGYMERAWLQCRCVGGGGSLCDLAF